MPIEKIILNIDILRWFGVQVSSNFFRVFWVWSCFAIFSEKGHLLTCCCLFFLFYPGQLTVVVLSAIKLSGTFGNLINSFVGPFIRPHPVLWRIIFGVSVMYAMLLQFALFQSFGDIKRTLKWLDPKRLNMERLEEKEYAVDCSNFTWERISKSIDIFVIGHFLGWMMKALLIRHHLICWYISIAWEVTELVFSHLLPNFEECWWDIIILDIFLCNGLGIYCGIRLAHFFEMREYHWESIKDIKTTRGKFKRAVLQFTPESWMQVDWYNDVAIRRTLSIYAFVMIWLVTELNTFFLKHIFAIDTSHPIVFWRIILIGLISAPSIRQFYLFATDSRVKRMGMQSWIYVAVCALEGAICVKFGRDQFSHINLTYICLWIAGMAVGTFFCVLLSVRFVGRLASVSLTVTEEKDDHGNVRKWYLDSSVENLGAIADDVRARRRVLNMSESDVS
ncbi:unnamed protein product [Enterobius vermicularis]|uniref:Phosphatidylserine synthase n=1 Tax=Enterobius vermicularis TaxID=51028 RepID=A0A0N4V6K3_ENTVE|nr:unnamed protein product [Enterobius vermicularis]